jgi:hypothetical protein
MHTRFLNMVTKEFSANCVMKCILDQRLSIVTKLCFNCVSLVFVLLMANSIVFSQDSTDSIKVFIERMQFERTRIRAGDCRIAGSRTSNQPGRTFDTPLEMRYVFDFASDRIFIDEKTTTFIDDTLKPVRRIAFRTGDRLFQYSSADSFPRVVISPFADRLPSHARNARGIMDIRSCGIAPYGLLGVNANYSLERVKATMLQPTERYNTFKLEQQQEGIYLITARHESYPARLRVFVDSKRGFTPFRMISDWGTDNADTTEFVVKDFQGQTDVGWKEDNGVWIPTYCEWINNRNTIPDGKEDKLENIVRDQQTEKWQFDWYSVNNPLDDTFWSYQNWDLPSNAIVFDFSKDKKGVFIEKIGDRPRQIEIHSTIKKERTNLYAYNAVLFALEPIRKPINSCRY